MDCKKCQSALPDLLLDPGSAASTAAGVHLAECDACREELRSLEETFALLDTWEAPEPSTYFDQRLAVRLREEQAQPPLNWMERMQQRLMLNTGRNFRPAVAGALGLVLLVVGGGTVANQTGVFHKNQPHTQVSATVVDLQILDRNEQAFQDMDQMLQDDGSSDDSGGTPST